MTTPAYTKTSPQDHASYDVEALRQSEFPVTRTTAFLNHAGNSPLPRRTFEALREANEQLMLNPALLFPVFMQRLEALYESLRALINAERADELVCVQSNSLGHILVAQSLPWKRGQNIILSEIEFPANAYPWMSAAAERGVEVRLVPVQNGGLTLDAMRPFVDENTALVAVSSVQFFTGHRTDLAAIGQFCRERGILFAVDAIQSVGHIPIDVQAAHIDILCSGGQKSLMGPPGIGFLYVRTAVLERMRPAILGGASTVDFMHWLKYDLTPQPNARRFMLGTFNFPITIALAESVALLRELGIPAIGSYTTALIDYAIERLRAAGYTVITPADHGPIVTFVAAETDADTDRIVKGLAARNVYVVKHWDAAKKPYVRASVHCYNNTDDIDRLLAGLDELSEE